MEQYAIDHHFPNPCFYVDDGYSGAVNRAKAERGERLGTREVWDIVQRVRQHKQRRTNMDEQNKYSGPVVCADCGTIMVLHRAHTMKPSQNDFTCRTYKKLGSKVCTAHYIRECVLEAVALENLRRVTAMATAHTREFTEYISGIQSAEVQRESRQAARELAAIKKRGTESQAFERFNGEGSIEIGGDAQDGVFPDILRIELGMLWADAEDISI